MDGKTTSEDYGSGSRGGVVDLGAVQNERDILRWQGLSQI